MANIRTLGKVAATAGTPTPVYTGPAANTIAATSFSITANIATIVLNTATFPKTGYNGGPLTGGGNAGGQTVTLWGFTTATYFNGKTVTVLDNNPGALSFRFAFTHANVASTNDAGNTAPTVMESIRAVRLEIDSGATTHIIYVGDLNVSASQYYARLLLPTSTVPWSQVAIEIGRDKIPADRIFIDTDSSTTGAQVSLIY